MVESELNPTRYSENPTGQVGLVACRLVHAYRARQDFASAITTAAKVSDLFERDRVEVKIARAQVQSGLEPLFHQTIF